MINQEPSPTTAQLQTLQREELVCAMTHGIGVIGSLVGGVVLITYAAELGGAREILSVSVFVLALILLYTASTLYHSFQHEVVKARLKVFDHCAIFLLIAGTYTPFTLLGLGGTIGWALFWLVWTLAAIGIVFKLFYTGRYKRLSTAIYVAMGWAGVLAAKPMMETVPATTLGWLLAGGISYTAGTYFYHNQRIPYSHAIWHLFVLGGSVTHFVAVTLQVLSTGKPLTP